MEDKFNRWLDKYMWTVAAVFSAGCWIVICCGLMAGWPITAYFYGMLAYAIGSAIVTAFLYPWKSSSTQGAK